MIKAATLCAGAPPYHRRTAAALLLLGLAAGLPILISPSGRGAGAAMDRCAITPELSSLGGPLPRTAERIKAGGSLTIVALGSSSTEGIGATRPEFSYPSRLAAVLRERFPNLTIRVVNRGVGGQMSPQMVARIDRDVMPERPDLVIWQLGTNSVLHGVDSATEGRVARHGIERLRATGADVVLMDLQYAPAVLVHTDYVEMLHAISSVARSEDVPLFRRFAVMHHWAEDGLMTLPVMLARDRLHMSDASYDCLARQLARSIVAAASRPDPVTVAAGQ